jgi:hypothetical protein
LQTGCIELYINAESADWHGSIMHKYLSSRDVPLSAEYHQSEHAEELAEKRRVPKRIVQNIEQLTAAKNLLFLRHSSERPNWVRNYNF